MKSQGILEVMNLRAGGRGGFMLRNISFTNEEGSFWAITGAAGSGKSTLLQAIKHYKLYPDNIRFKSGAPTIGLIGHQHQFTNLSGMHDFYYQQRFNASEADDAETVLQELLKKGFEKEEVVAVLELLRIDHLIDTPLLQLSNGEHKRFQIAGALIEKVDWLLLDNPFTGLDVDACNMLEKIIQDIHDSGTNILLVTKDRIPHFVTDVAVMEAGRVVSFHSREEYLEDKAQEATKNQEIFALPQSYQSVADVDFEYAVRMEKVGVTYNNRKILNDIDWEVKRGERWNLSGPNGSGKSTLLSLITADNPQAFANDIYLFDRKRGSGETIWDIKSRIGFVSPEVHYYFDKTFTCFNTIASGLFDTIGLFRKLKAEDKERVEECMELFKITDLKDRVLSSLSHGMQRWVLLARAIVKNPPLLILDEPCQGLDNDLRDRFLNLIETFFEIEERTLIYVTHVKEEIPECITHFLKLENGLIKEKFYNEQEYNGNSGRWNRTRSYERSY